MHMGNYLGCGALVLDVMAASSRRPFGIRHTTVVPTNYTPEDDSETDDEG
jgi:hypothetical protein